MIVYLFNENVYSTINLPVKVSGMYSIYAGDRLFANIVSENGKWIVRLSDEFMSIDLSMASSEIFCYKLYKVMSNLNNEKFYFIS